jgi:hypothetical protein
LDDRTLIDRFDSLLTALLAATTAEAAGTPSERLIRCRSIAGELSGQLPQLHERFERLAELEEDFRHTVETARLDAMRELAYGASHEINNPLANISARAQTLLQEEKDPERRRRLAAINSQAFRAHEMIADMMLFARPPQLAPRTANLLELVDEVLTRLKDEAATQNTELLRTGSNDPLNASVDPTQLRAALRALLTNSLEALAEGGRVTVSVRRAAAIPAARGVAPVAEIIVADNGPGIPPEIRSRLFDPFFSGREAGRGLGLGLSKCWQIVAAHGGRIDIAGEKGQGATFSLIIPLKAAPPRDSS